jgi:hypothetical protein
MNLNNCKKLMKLKYIFYFDFQKFLIMYLGY